MLIKNKTRGCIFPLGIALAGLLGLLGWAVAGTLKPDGPRVPPPPPALSLAAGDFSFVVEPIDASIDRPISVRLSDLQPGETVVLKGFAEDAASTAFSSWAQFEADDAGALDLSNSEPLEGSYQGVDPSGLLWAMQAPKAAPFITSAKWDRRQVQLRAETESGFREVTLTRRYPWPETVLEEIETRQVIGELSYRASEEPLPVILLLAGWGDGPTPLTAALLAVRGYAVLNLGYHDWPGLPERLVEIPVETVGRAIDWIEQDPRLDSSRIGIHGISKGAELALLAATLDPRIGPVSAWVPSSVAFAGIDFSDPDPGSSWTLGGQPVPYSTSSRGLAEVRNTLRFLLRRPLNFRPTYARALSQAPANSFLEVENIAGPLLLVSGTDDQVWPSSVMAEQIEDRWKSAQKAPTITNLVFERAGHGINPSLWPRGGRRTGTFLRGGTASIDHRAGQAAWQAMVEFFDRELEPEAR